MGKGKMNGDNSADSKGPDHKIRGSGGTTKKNKDTMSNNKAQNMKGNSQ